MFQLTCVLVGLLLWEICFFLGLIDPNKLSHPTAVIGALLEESFVKGFVLMVVQSAGASVVGLAIGIAIGSKLIRSPRATEAAICFLRVAIWLPFLTAWAIPIPVSVSQPNQADQIVWTWTVTISTVTLFACYYYLTLCFVLGLEFRHLR